MNTNLTSKAISGFQWTTISTIITSIMQIGYTSVMSRLLDPQAFGLIAISQIIINFGYYFARLGMGPALIQKKEINEYDIRAVFTSSLLLGIGFITLVWIFAPLSHLIFNKVDEEVVKIIRLMSISFFVSGLSITSGSLLTRNLKFRLLSILEIVSYIISYLGIGITMALLDFGVYSLVFAQVSQSILRMILNYAYTRHSLKLLFKWQYHKHFFSYGTRLSLTNFMEFLSANVSPILIGRFFGDNKLGFFRQANMIAQLPMEKFNRSIGNVMFPLFSKIQTEIERFKKSYLEIITFVSAILFPVGFGMSVASKEIVLVLFGDKFADSGPILQFLSIGMAFRFITTYGGTVCDATANLNFKLITQSIYLVAFAALGYYFKDYGIVGFAIIVMIGDVVMNLAYMYVAGKILKVSAREYVKAFYPGILIGCITAFIIYLTTWILDYFNTVLFVKFILQVIAGAISLLYFTLIKPLPIMRALMKERIDKIPIFKGKARFILNHLSWYN